jgi:hypothetical protein
MKNTPVFHKLRTIFVRNPIFRYRIRKYVEYLFHSNEIRNLRLENLKGETSETSTDEMRWENKKVKRTYKNFSFRFRIIIAHEKGLLSFPFALLTKIIL